MGVFMPDDKIDETQQGEKKIIIDEDWKSQVQAEKEEAGQEKPAHSEQKSAPDEHLPPPTLTFLASSLYLQGAIALGLLPNPVSEKAGVQPNQARHAIDMLTMLQQKTEGNRTTDESEEIEYMLHQLRMAYVSVTQK
jgi:hypothetical protein